MKIFQDYLKTLLNDLDAANAACDGIHDTEYLGTAVLNGFLRKQPNYTLPQTSDRDEDVRMAMLGFLMAVRDLASRDRETLGSFHKRLAAFQDKNTVSDMGHNFEYFFRRLNGDDFDENGKRLDGRDI